MNFRLLAALLAASEGLGTEDTPYEKRIVNRWNLMRKWVKANLVGHLHAEKTADNQEPKAIKKINRGEKYMLDYYKRKLNKITDPDKWSRCSGHDQAESSVPDVTHEVGTAAYAIAKMNQVVEDVFTEECKFKPALTETRRAMYENLLNVTFMKYAKQCKKINPFECDTEYCVAKQYGWGSTKCTVREEEVAMVHDDEGDTRFGEEGKYEDTWWMNYN